MSEKDDIKKIHDSGTGTDLLPREQQKLKKPGMYRVVLLNDDYTPMEFVIWLLVQVFHKGKDEATRLMLEVHNKGRGVAGVYTHDVARTKVFQVQALAEKNGHPLQSVIEAEGDQD